MALTVNSGGIVNVSGTGTLHMASALATAPSDNIAVSSGGQINLSGGSIDVHDSNAIAAGGTVTQTGGTYKVFHDFHNSGTYTATAGTIEFAGTGGGNAFNAPGTNQFFNVTIDAGITTNFNSNIAAVIGVGGDWTNDGTATLTATTVTFNGSSAQQIKGSSATTFGPACINPVGEVPDLAAFEEGAGTVRASGHGRILPWESFSFISTTVPGGRRRSRSR